jgi:hypothetical protein
LLKDLSKPVNEPTIINYKILKSNTMIKRLVRKDQTSHLNDLLPKLKSFAFSESGVIGYSGSIIKRPLTSEGLLSHYALFLGFDENGRGWMLENNEDGVECVTWKDFLSGSSMYEIVHFEKDLTRFKDVLKRIHERYHLKYVLLSNNCEHFVNFCVHSDFNSHQANRGKKFIDALSSIVEAYIITHENPSIRDAIESWDEMRNEIDVPRENKSLDDLIKKRKPK